MPVEFVADSRALTFTPGTLDKDMRRLSALLESGWQQLASLPARSERSSSDTRRARDIITAIAELSGGFCRCHREPLYDALTQGRRERERVDALCRAAAERWPGLVPSESELAEESRRMQAEKVGRELLQGVFVGELLADRSIGTHLIESMLAPTERASDAVAELTARGRLDLGTVTLELEGEVGYVTFDQPRFLNAEDDETIEALETAVDVVLLHPDVRVGVLRGGAVTHPKYRDRRIFSAGINLTKLYHGDISYLFYLVRDLGLVHKIYRGLAIGSGACTEPESTLEKPWLAVVDGFAIGGGCQLLLVADYVLAESGAYFNLPARKEGIIPGAANLRLARFIGERAAREAILFDRSFPVDEPIARRIVSEVHPASELDAGVSRTVANATGSGMVSASGNRKALRVQAEPLDAFRRYMATYAREQAFCHLSDQLVHNLERHWNAKSRTI